MTRPSNFEARFRSAGQLPGRDHPPLKSGLQKQASRAQPEGGAEVRAYEPEGPPQPLSLLLRSPWFPIS